jgi:hypothetical protein
MTIICCCQFTGRGILAFAHFYPALYLPLRYDSRQAVSTRCRLGSRSSKLFPDLEAQRFARDFFTFQKTTQFVISAYNATLSIVAVRVSNLDYRISVAVGGDRAF